MKVKNIIKYNIIVEYFYILYLFKIVCDIDIEVEFWNKC